jgi:anti-sigma28 factor (negative regulator of flagellin synthesis)
MKIEPGIMKIQKTGIIKSSYSAPTASQSTSKAAPLAPDTSLKAAMLQKARAILEAREAEEIVRAGEIKAAVEAGKYEIDYDALARVLEQLL